MEKTKYYVHGMHNITRTYVTTTRNREDMIQQIKEMHEPVFNDYFRISVIENGDRKFIYAKQNSPISRKWKSLLHSIHNEP